ncbi:hypothetical protein ACI7RC_17605 [Brevibacillus sp. B_LB10_24]|uniref:hypothetical protein n=1 Tax=Brevibacillus sp. B_LB10_24 TaxID=3380645 RepID=UPI0038B9BC94
MSQKQVARKHTAAYTSIVLWESTKQERQKSLPAADDANGKVIPFREQAAPQRFEQEATVRVWEVGSHSDEQPVKLTQVSSGFGAAAGAGGGIRACAA